MKRIFSIIILSLCLTPASAYAEVTGAQFGFVYGLSVPDAENTTPHYINGLKGSAFLSPAFSIGGYTYDAHSSYGTGSREFKYSYSGLECVGHLPAGSGDTFFAVRFGITKAKVDVGGTDAILSPYHYGIAAGYDHYVFSWLAVGFEGSFLYSEKSKTTVNGSSYEEDAFSAIQFIGTLQFRL